MNDDNRDSILDAVIPLLADPDNNVVKEAMRVLKKAGVRAANQVVEKLDNENDEEKVTAYLICLWKMGSPAFPPLIKKTSVASEDLQERIKNIFFDWLNDAGTKVAARKALEDAKNNKDEGISLWATVALYEFDHQ